MQKSVLLFPTWIIHRILETCNCILVSYSWQPPIITPYSKRCMYSCVIFLATLYYCTVFQRCTYCILVSYSWQPPIITPYSERCMYSCVISWQPCIIAPYSETCLLYSCVIFLATSYYCTIFQKVHVFLCHILGNLVLLHRILKHALIVFLCHILGNLLYYCTMYSDKYYCTYSKTCLLYSCVIFLATSYYCTVFQKVCIFLCHILFKLILLHRVQMVAHILMSYYLCGIKVPHDNISLVVSY